MKPTCPEDGDNMCLRNVGIYLQVHTASQPTRTTSSSSPPRRSVRNSNLTWNKYYRQFPTSKHVWIPILDRGRRTNDINNLKNRSCFWKVTQHYFICISDCAYTITCVQIFYLTVAQHFGQCKHAFPFAPHQWTTNCESANKTRHWTWPWAHNQTRHHTGYNFKLLP
jgi:hypothetical protein